MCECLVHTLLAHFHCRVRNGSDRKGAGRIAFPPRKHGIWYLKSLLFLVPPRSRFQAAEPMLKGDVGRRPATDWPESVTKSRERHGNHAGNSHSSAAANIFHFFNMPANNTNTNTIASMFSIVVMWVLSMCGLRRCCLRRVQKYVTALSRSRPRPRPGGTICGGKGPALLPCRVVSSRVVSSRATCAVEKRHMMTGAGCSRSITFSS